MSTQFSTPESNLVLKVSGGHRDGELIHVTTQKCFLGAKSTGNPKSEPRCAIFRGSKGAAVRSYSDDVTVNGIGSTVHWLMPGDQISFDNTMTVEVTELGIEPDDSSHESAAGELVPEETAAETQNEADLEARPIDIGQAGFQVEYVPPSECELSSEWESTVEVEEPVVSTSQGVNEECADELAGGSEEEALYIADSQEAGFCDAERHDAKCCGLVDETIPTEVEAVSPCSLMSIDTGTEKNELGGEGSWSQNEAQQLPEFQSEFDVAHKKRSSSETVVELGASETILQPQSKTSVESCNEPNGGTEPKPESSNSMTGSHDHSGAFRDEIEQQMIGLASQIRDTHQNSVASDASVGELSDQLGRLSSDVSRLVEWMNQSKESRASPVISPQPTMSELEATSTAESDSSHACSHGTEHNFEQNEPTFAEPSTEEPCPVELDRSATSNDSVIEAQADLIDFDVSQLHVDHTDENPGCETAEENTVNENDSSGELRGISQAEIDARLAEMERVFSGSIMESAPEPESESKSAESEIQAEPAAELEPTVEPEATQSPTHLGSSPTILLQPELETAMPNPDELSNQDLETHAADDQPAEYFEDLTHCQNDGVDSSAADSMHLELEDSIVDQFEEDLSDAGALASQLIQDVESNVRAAMDEAPESSLNEPEEAEPEVAEPEPQPKKTESVAELLARMKSEGQWSGIPDEDEGEIRPIEPVMKQAETYAEPASDNFEEEDVEDYMSQLLNRMRGGAPERKPVIEEVKFENTEAADVTEEVDVSPPANPLRPEEFVPSRKAEKIQSFDAMRELANSSARSAVMQSEEGRRKALALLQLGISIASFIMSIYYFGFASQAWFDVPFVIGLTCFGTCGFLGYRFYGTVNEVGAEVMFGSLLEKIHELKAGRSKNESATPAE